MIVCFYPLCRSDTWSFFTWWLMLPSSELVQRYLCALPKTMVIPTPLGWKKDPWTYVCLFVGLMCALMSSLVCKVYAFVYSGLKWTSVVEHSPVNFIVFWPSFHLFRKFSN